MSSLGVAIVRRYQRGVVFRWGKLRKVRNPGIRFMIPLVDRMIKVTLRTVTMPIPSQQVRTRPGIEEQPGLFPDGAFVPPMAQD